MKNSVRKRLRITKRGKIMRRPSGIDHFQSKRSGNSKRRAKKLRGLKNLYL